MEGPSLQKISVSQEFQKCVHTDAFKYSIITLVALAAVSLIAVSSGYYSGLYLNSLGNVAAAAMMSAGGLLLFGEIVSLIPKKSKEAILSHKDSVLSYKEWEDHNSKIDENEFFVFHDENGEKRIHRYIGESIGSVPYSDYEGLRNKGCTQVSLKELQSRKL